MAVLTLMLLFLGLPSGKPAAKPQNRPSLYWGAWIGGQLTGTQAPWDVSAIFKFKRKVGKPLSMVHFAAPFANCASPPCSFYPFPTPEMRKVRRLGAIPFFSWASQMIPGSANEPDFQLSDVVAGTYDSHIRSFAEDARSWGHPFFLRFNFEMNGDWFSWSEQANGNQPGEYVAAWRHVHDIFTSIGATNATWVWCPNTDPDNTLQALGPLYPGDAYVDWTCLDGYNFGTHFYPGAPAAPPQGWRSFDQLFRSTYLEITRRIAPDKPMIIGEVASSDFGGSKARWIRNMLAKIPTRYPRIRGVLWWEDDADGVDWPIVGSKLALKTFRQGIRKRAFTSNRYAKISARPIRPPR